MQHVIDVKTVNLQRNIAEEIKYHWGIDIAVEYVNNLMRAGKINKLTNQIIKNFIAFDEIK